MSTPSAVAVYARISADIEGEGLGVARQLEDCRNLADQLGWTIGEEYVDNDISAYSGKRRPAYESMLEDIAAGRRDGVLVYHADRLTRRPIELEEFVQVVERAGVRNVRFVASGELDVASGDGLMVLRMMAAVAANESASKSRRLRRKHEQLAAEGKVAGGGQRPFGYAEDKITIVESEAEVIRTLADRFVAGESTSSLVRWLNDEQIRTATGIEWKTSALRQMLCSGRIAGLRQHHGEVIGPAVWDGIITPAQRDQILAVMETRKRSGRRAPRRYLLSGLCKCSKCGHTLYSSARENTRRYVCSSAVDHGGCGGTFVVAEPVDQLVADAVLYRLNTPELADALAGRAAADEQAAALSVEVSADQEQLEELAQMYAAREITAREWKTARKPIEGRIENAERRMSRITRTDALDGLVGNGEELGRQWAALNLDRQSAIIKAVVDRVVILPGSPRAQALDPGRVEIIWRL